MSVNRPFGRHWRGGLVILAIIILGYYAYSAYSSWMGSGAG